METKELINKHLLERSAHFYGKLSKSEDVIEIKVITEIAKELKLLSDLINGDE